ncbi:MAG: DUF6390 family protein, partial [Candidatus Micrarchaeota archaeon]|nr:DUF6390 family protein [Candidatus Micrarchaeota archaeon]
MQAEKAIVQGITRALKYAFPPNQLKNCGPKLEVDEYKRLFSDMEKAREFLMSLPFLGKCCAKIAAYKGLDTFDSRVVDAYFLGIDPFVDNNRPITPLMNRLLT